MRLIPLSLVHYAAFNIYSFFFYFNKKKCFAYLQEMVVYDWLGGCGGGVRFIHYSMHCRDINRTHRP